MSISTEKGSEVRDLGTGLRLGLQKSARLFSFVGLVLSCRCPRAVQHPEDELVNSECHSHLSAARLCHAARTAKPERERALPSPSAWVLFRHRLGQRLPHAPGRVQRWMQLLRRRSSASAPLPCCDLGSGGCAWRWGQGNLPSIPCAFRIYIISEQI